jgi:ATP-dependent Zn protease
MKSFAGVMVLVMFSLFIFGGMLEVFTNVQDPSKLQEDSQNLYATLNNQYNNNTFEQLNVTNPELGIQNEDAFAAEFYSASTDSQKKATTLDKAKNIPNLVRFSIGQDASFDWAWVIAMGFIVTFIGLIVFVVIFRREVFR